MAGDSVDASKLTGMSKIFNGSTMRGRANVALATYASVGLLIAYFSLKPSKPKAPKN
ncbi:ATP synthase membrane subunit K, mitochondrial-like [Diabrotica virgifera virgifera]|uniref:Up-regulated during skeletal muscle growth protein 5 n=1 Tax=Diabrotica virgifera virgifera TaxID=50390 RepID=A0ABM5IR15_DIAVI|nr:ATP synthase membrane subunit K, mitochondrial-like [Diabrotica virgifera virgifera]XP_028139254.2 ATP synthase membrane subunit K, mitochondrial-like [Diabrotica virgifera virgifera]